MLGNFWSDYNGTDTKNDRVGDTPYFIGGTLQDNYPLMSPVDIANVNIPSYQWESAKATQTNSPAPTPTLPHTTPVVNLQNAEQQSQNIIFELELVGVALLAGAISIVVLKRTGT